MNRELSDTEAGAGLCVGAACIARLAGEAGVWNPLAQICAFGIPSG